MKRVAFNGGEISPEMALRADMDAYPRSCSKLVNFDVSQMGGISRRRGMRRLVQLDAETETALFPYTYTEDDVYLVELRPSVLIVRDLTGAEVSRHEGGYSWNYPDVSKVTVLQLNAELLVLHPEMRVMKLRLLDSGAWTFGTYSYKMQPWYTIDARDRSVKISPYSGAYKVTFDEAEDFNEAGCVKGDIFRASYFTQQQEAFEYSRVLRASVRTLEEETLSGATFSVGEKVAVRSELSCTYWVCTETSDGGWVGSRDFVEGLSQPSNYQESFVQAEDLTGFDEVEPIYELTADMTFKRGDKVAVQSGYWEYYSCIRTFTPTDYVATKTGPAQYPSHFIRGIPVGPALASKGTWSFYCSGLWYGSYEVRRCYDGTDLSLAWEMRGESFSRISSSSNEQISGDEEGEECWLRLFLTRSKYLGEGDITSGFPADACGNRLIVNGYMHDMLLRCEIMGEDVYFVDETPIRVQLEGDIITTSWSWQAFSDRYGFPRVALLHESRLVFASTKAQPQTMWFSAVDDLNNFDVGELDSSGMLLTMATATQSGICWACSRGDIIMLGTEGAEWCIKGADNSPLTSKNIRLTNYGYHGSAHIPALLTCDSVLYVERGAGRVFEYRYVLESNSYGSHDLTVFAPHVAESHGGIVRGTEVRKPDHKAVFVMGDGSLSLMTVNTFHNVNAWHHYETDGQVLSVCALPDGQRADKLFCVVMRDGERWLEVIDTESEYVDAESRDYVSTMETTALSDPQGNDRKGHLACFEMFVGEECAKAGVEVMAGSGEYKPFAGPPVMKRGWVEMTGEGDWTQVPVLGVRCRGNRPLKILAVQA